MNERTATELLKRRSNKVFKILIKHSNKVKQIALQIAKQIKNKKIDLEFIKTASILHDIGRYNCPPRTKKSPFHGIEGSKILRKLGLEKHARVAERHLGGGIDKKEAKKIGFPPGKYMPITIEEKIISYADNLTAYDKKISIKKAIDRFEKEIGMDAANKIIKLHNYLVSKGMKGKQLTLSAGTTQIKDLRVQKIPKGFLRTRSGQRKASPTGKSRGEKND